MNYCLWCEEEISYKLNWSNIFHGVQKEKICQRCNNQLTKIEGARCGVCSRKTDEVICNDCRKWQLVFDGEDPLVKNISIFTYNDFMKEVVTKWKYRGDYLLGEIFRETFRQAFNQYYKQIDKQLIIVPIPLSKERLLERRFNQSLQLAEYITPDPSSVLRRIHGEKQSKKTRIERMSSNNPFIATKSLNKTAILVDDIYTTGRTIRHAAHVLKKSGSPAVYSLTLVRG